MSRMGYSLTVPSSSMTLTSTLSSSKYST
ncbi:hypothetical protein CY0110_19477 [Crocosphaera chwakensis CCY0110]|uniref:Uncharacterized protein n=1 Tax=Crocosphaera chwakensis CCY0110 TaxID=391612 RepID=A3IJM7_9CHRO|nr:hypothetical protein CY0110_19477 [Crocosphaera chwakensis CCY0110]